jgi:hypothetical protein
MESNLLLLNFLIPFIGFVLTIYQLWKGNKEKTISNVIALKNEMYKYDEIHFKLLPNGEWEKFDKNYFLGNQYDVVQFGKLVSYLGLFEIAKEMLDNSSLKKSHFDVFFKYRLNLIFTNNAVKNYINSEQASWNKLITLSKQIL